MNAALRTNAGPVATGVAAVWWLVEVTRAWAGRDAPSVTVGALLIAIAVVLMRPDRVLPWQPVALAAGVSAAAFIVPLTAPTGWSGAPDAAVYACTAWLTVVVAATVVARPDAWIWLTLLIAVSATVEFMSGWDAWWGGEDPALPMIGTFYWHNPYAAFLIPGGLVGLGFWIWRTRLFALIGIICFSFATIGIVYSTSRAALAVFVLGVLLIAVVGLLGSQRGRALRQAVIAVVLAIGAAYFVGGPPFFSHRASPLAAEHARTAGQSLGQNGGYRLDFWREALTVFRRHPVTGGGYKSLVGQSINHVPSSWPLSPYAHNGYLQALGEGGLVLGIPFLLAVLVIAFLCVRMLVRGLIQRRLAADETVVAIALACVLLHSGVDFDWTYAADFALAGLLAGLVVGRSLTPPEPVDNTDKPTTRRVGPAALAAVMAGVALLGVSAWAARHGNHRENIMAAVSTR